MRDNCNVNFSPSAAKMMMSCIGGRARTGKEWKSVCWVKKKHSDILILWLHVVYKINVIFLIVSLQLSVKISVLSHPHTVDLCWPENSSTSFSFASSSLHSFCFIFIFSVITIGLLSVSVSTFCEGIFPVSYWIYSWFDAIYSTCSAMPDVTSTAYVIHIGVWTYRWRKRRRGFFFFFLQILNNTYIFILNLMNTKHRT